MVIGTLVAAVAAGGHEKAVPIVKRIYGRCPHPLFMPMLTAAARKEEERWTEDLLQYILDN